MLDIEILKTLNSTDRITVTEHARIRLLERGISIDDIVLCIKYGEIIRQYEDDKPFPSCLILGKSVKNRWLHIVVSCDGDFIHLITAYYPDKDQWEDDFKTRKEYKK